MKNNKLGIHISIILLFLGLSGCKLPWVFQDAHSPEENRTPEMQAIQEPDNVMPDKTEDLSAEIQEETTLVEVVIEQTNLETIPNFPIKREKTAAQSLLASNVASISPQQMKDYQTLLPHPELFCEQPQDEAFLE